MTPSQLKEHILSTGEERHFFDRETMRFFGDRMSNFGVRRVRVSGYGDEVNPQTRRYEVQEFEAWELYRRRPVKHGLRSSHYFRADNFRQIHYVKD